eukprot:jgi/Mesen1/9598/ME000657S08869
MACCQLQHTFSANILEQQLKKTSAGSYGKETQRPYGVYARPLRLKTLKGLHCQLLTSAWHDLAALGSQRASARRKTTVPVGGSARASASYEALKGYEVLKASTGERVELLSLWQPAPGRKVVVAFLTHFADLSSWEYAQQLVKVVLPAVPPSVTVVAVGLGSAENARRFAGALDFPLELLHADPDGSLYRALGFSPGFGESVGVLRGYVGDRGSKPVFDGQTPFDILGTGYQRPFELASLRLMNMVGILPKWGELCPPKTELLTQQGGTLVFDGDREIFRHTDSGILKYTRVDALIDSLQIAPAFTDV